MNIFVLHPSELLTDHAANGDGLIAYGFIAALASRGHRIHVAYERIDLSRNFTPNVTLHPVALTETSAARRRVEYALKVRALYGRLRRITPFDVVHQLNPVHSGLSLAMLGIAAPIVLGTFVPRWPYDCDALAPLPVSARQRAANLAQAPLLLAQQLLASALVLAAPQARNRLASPRWFSKKIFRVRHAVDVERFMPSPRADGAADAILFFANLGTRKGIFTLLEAFEAVAKAHPAARLIVAGAGWEAPAIEAAIGALECRKRVSFLGAIARADVPALMARAAIYCLPSYGEPYATSIIEAMACGMAVVATDAGGFPSMVDAHGSVLVPPRDVRALADALLAVLRDPAQTARMGAFNREYALATYAWPVVAKALEDVYRSVARA